MLKDYTHITIVLDRSGSMSSIKNDVIGGTNQFLGEQKKVAGKCTVTLVQFDSQDPYEVLADMQEVEDVKPLSDTTYQPRANTPLLDCVGRAINDLGARLSNMSEDQRPEKVIFVIVTDGLENASREFKRDQIQRMIEEQTQVYNWDFVFLSADISAVNEAISMGIPMASAMAYDHTSVGTQTAFAAAASNVASYRANKRSNVDWSEEDRAQQKNESLRK